MVCRIAVAQCNLVVGDFEGNTRQIIAAARRAYEAGASLVLTPELSICGYAAEDLFLRPSFVAACNDAVRELAEALRPLTGLAVVVGHPFGRDHRSRSMAISSRFNAASVVRDGHIVARYAKRELPNYQVFDERRYFASSRDTCVFEVCGPGKTPIKVGLLICEDAWYEAPARAAREAGAQCLAVINASPFHGGKGVEREAMMRRRVFDCGLPLVYAHLVGGQDEMVFEGGSFVLNADGTLGGMSPCFVEDDLLIDVEHTATHLWLTAPIAQQRSADADLWDALVLGVRDYVEKNGFPSVLLGLSGGIDSALVLTIAVDALGPQRVHAMMMPSPYTADISLTDARQLAQTLGVRYDELSIVPALDAFLATLAPPFAGTDPDTTEENLQARIRGTLLMALSNKFGSLVLTTGNKSELATGYCTLYGDMAGGFAVIKDLYKTVVYRLAQWRNENDPYGRGVCPIPDRILQRAPSAELRPDQTDQDSLPPYDVLDAILLRYVENDESIEDIVRAGFDRAVVTKVVGLLRANEYKRKQSAIGIRVTHRSFGKDWRYPITQRYRA
ncbi:NAD+ synthase [Candidatus Symbiobacter mobilis]|nr:NAD+ synthase [Candidatus Symbiobacter mobilis]